MHGVTVPSARLRSDLVLAPASFPIVLLVYAAAGAVLFVLWKFLVGFYTFSMALSLDETTRTATAFYQVIVWAALLGFVVSITVFGGGALFLVRSRRLERLLNERAAELEGVDGSRRLFFAKASHELRTPVTAIRGEAEVALATAQDTSAMRSALEHVAAQSVFLGHRIEEMIGIAQTSDGKLHLDHHCVDLCEIVSDAVKEARLFANTVEATVVLSLPPNRIAAFGDELWLKRAILAVIENALKFSPVGSEVKVALTHQDTRAIVKISDKGPGVVADELPLIFDAYYQTQAGKDRGGSGLGLAMTRWVAEQHGGDAWARNIRPLASCPGCEVTISFKCLP